MEIKSLIQKGEGTNVEFKQTISSSKKVAKEIAAFANTKGGYLFIGIDDSGNPVGVNSPEKEREALLTASNVFCSPPVPIDIMNTSLDKKPVLIVRVHEGKEKPYHCTANSDTERVYIRVKDKNLMASKDVVKSIKNECYHKRKKDKLDKNQRKLVDFLKENEKVTLREFKKFANLSKRRASKILFKMVRTGLIRNHTLEKEPYYTSSFE